MSERCGNCGAELYAGQQFCRRCGAAVRAEDAGEAPTQMLGPGARETGGAYDPELTAPFSGGGAAGTDPSMRPPPTAPQAPFVRFNPTTPLEPAAARKERARWVLPFVLGVALACVGGLLIYMQSSHRKTVRKPTEVKKVVVAPPQMPPLPPEAVEAIKRAAGDARQWEDLASLAPMDEAGADTDDDETVVTKTYPLAADAAFVLRNRKGDITVEGWDKESAQVRVTKRGGSAEERRAPHVLVGMRGERLVLASAARGEGPVEVSYEIKLPRSLRQLEISADESEVKLAGMKGSVVVDVKQGTLEFVDVTGTTLGKLIKGKTKVAFPGAAPDGAQEFTVMSGNVEVDLAAAMNADVKAETMDGDVEADSSLGLKLVKTAAGQHALGRLGAGADPLLIKVVNGDIKLRK